jgi:hypothetical protein
MHMAAGQTGFADATYDLIAVQYHALKAGHDYGQYVRDAENAGLNDIAQFFRDTLKKTAPAPPGRTSCSGTSQGPGKPARRRSNRPAGTAGP